MKKTYIMPQMAITLIETSTMIAASVQLTLDNTDANKVTEESELLTRKSFSAWDEEEEEEE